MKPIAFATLVLALATATAACKKPASPASAVPGSVSGTVPGTVPGVPGAPVAAKPVPAQLPPVLARVNGEAIERWEFDTALKRIEQRAGPVPPDKRDEAYRSVIDQLVAFHLIAQEARAKKLNATDADVQARILQIIQGFPNEDAFKQGIAAQGMTLDNLRAQTRSSLEVSKFIDAEVNAAIAVPDAEVEGFYQQNLERFKQGETVHAAHILIGVPQGATIAQKADAKTRAQAALKQVKSGTPFEEVAKARSQDPGSAPNGGDLGFFPKGQMTPAFEQAAFTLKPGAVSGLVETPFGFHIIKMIEKRPPRTAPLAEVGGQIKQFLEQGQREKKLDEFVTGAKGKAKIEILV
jgi:peptidyl-prolyl cis-trans isomerase C